MAQRPKPPSVSGAAGHARSVSPSGKTPRTGRSAAGGTRPRDLTAGGPAREQRREQALTPLPSVERISGRWLAFQTLLQWESADEALENCLDAVTAQQGVDGRERGLAHELSYGVVRWLSRLDELLSQLLREPLHKLHPPIRMLLRLGIYQLRASRAPARAVVHETVDMVKKAGCPWGTGLVNGVLRTYDRERERLEGSSQGPGVEALARRTAHPPWLVRRLGELVRLDAELGSLEAWLDANNQVPPLTLRANGPRATREALQQRLAETLASRAGSMTPCAFAPEGLRLQDGGSPERLPGFSEGLFAIQDEASQLVAWLVGAQAGERVLDACAAPGGKTCALASQVGKSGVVIATDVSSPRIEQMKPMLLRLVDGRPVALAHDWTAGTSPDIIPEDPGEDLPEPLRAPFDRALVDAPCSGIGVIRRIPEIKWRRHQADLPRFVERQQQILAAVAARVKVGGTLVYSVCSPLLEEGPQVVEAFLQRNGAWQRVDLRTVLPVHVHTLVTPDGFLRTVPHRDGCDAFFAARMVRR